MHYQIKNGFERDRSAVGNHLMSIKVSCPCGHIFEEPDSSKNRTVVCPNCNQAVRVKAAPITSDDSPANSGTQFCRHCNDQTTHEAGMILHATYRPAIVSSFWSFFADLRRLDVSRCLTCGHLELFARKGVFSRAESARCHSSR